MELLGLFIPPEDRWEYDDADFHSVVTISLGELVHDGVIVWDEPEMRWDAYNTEQFWRVTKAVEERYFDREIGILPISSWKRRYVGRMNELMRKLRLAYEKLDGANLMQTSDSFSKNRAVGSAFPATQLKPTTQDYASDASDYEGETVVEGNYVEQAKLLDEYDDLDKQLVDYVDVLFSSLFTVNSNAF